MREDAKESEKSINQMRASLILFFFSSVSSGLQRRMFVHEGTEIFHLEYRAKSRETALTVRCDRTIFAGSALTCM